MSCPIEYNNILKWRMNACKIPFDVYVLFLKQNMTKHISITRKNCTCMRSYVFDFGVGSQNLSMLLSWRAEMKFSKVLSTLPPPDKPTFCEYKWQWKHFIQSIADDTTTIGICHGSLSDWLHCKSFTCSFFNESFFKSRTQAALVSTLRNIAFYYSMLYNLPYFSGYKTHWTIRPIGHFWDRSTLRSIDRVHWSIGRTSIEAIRIYFGHIQGRTPDNNRVISSYIMLNILILYELGLGHK